MNETGSQKPAGYFVNVSRIFRIIGFLVLLTGAAYIWRFHLYHLVMAIFYRQGSSHGIFVPFISAYLLWRKFETLKKVKFQTALLPGGLMLIVAIILYYLGTTENSFSLHVLSFFFVTAGIVLLFFGRETFKETMFPIFFLVTMIPLPQALYKEIAYWMRWINTSCSVSVAKIFGVPLYREGFDIFMPEIHFFVADSCSGIRYLLSYFTFCLVYAFLCKQSYTARVCVVLCSIPLAVAAGIARLSAIFLAVYYISPYWAGSRPHILLSWFVFTFFLFAAMFLDRYVSSFAKKSAGR